MLNSMFEIDLIGCYPVMTGRVKPKGWFVNELNDMIILFNGKLYYKLIEIMPSTLEGTSFFIANDMVE